ncbi:MAG: hypothetical protein HY316_00230 [Acidobacteria bacterium]|nr:hypothetical protein [Acidobacteriota bacterium]
MTYSRKHLNENAIAALRIMFNELGLKWIKIKNFEPDQPEFAEIFPTTWDDLVKNGWVHRYEGRLFPLYSLTGSGWIAALREVGQWDTDELRKMAGDLSAALKKHVEGRGGDAPVTVAEVTMESGLEENWIRNAIESHLIRELFHQIDAEWDPGDPEFNNHILIPRRFGHK